MSSPRLWSALPTLLAVFGCDADRGNAAGNSGSETHWLTACDEERPCGEGQCVCGVCTRACASDESCAELGVDVDVECRATADEPGCGTRGAPARVCLAAEPVSDAGGSGRADGGSAGGLPSFDASSGGTGAGPAADGSAAGGAASGGLGGTGPDASTNAGGPPSLPFPAPALSAEDFCTVVEAPLAEACQGAAACPIVMATGFVGTLRGLDAGPDDAAHAVLTSESDVCVLSAAPGAVPTTALNPFALPVDALPNVPTPLAVSPSGVRHVFIGGEAAAVHFVEQGDAWTSELLTVPEQLDVRVHGATFADEVLDIVYSAHLPNPGSAYRHTLYAGRSGEAGAWETVTLWEGAGERQLDAVFFPVGDGEPSAYWYASRDDSGLQGWRRSAGAASGRLVLDYPWDLPNPVGRLTTGEALVTAIERAQNPNGPLHVGLASDASLLTELELPNTEGRPYNSGCPVTPGTFRMGIGTAACEGHAGEACTLVVDQVGPPRWANTADGNTWLAYVESQNEWDITLAERCLEAEIDPGCLCEADANVPTVSREVITMTLAQVRVERGEIIVDPRLRLEGTPNLWFLEAHGSSLVFGFDGSVVIVDAAVL